MFKFNIRIILFTLFVVTLIVCSVVLAFWYLIIYPASITQGSEQLTSEARKLTKFSAIDVSDKITLQITQGDTETAQVFAEDNIIKNIKTEVIGNTLHISFAKWGLFGLQTINPHADVRVILNYKDLENLNISGSAVVAVENKARVDKFNLNMSGDSKAALNIFANSIVSNLSGSTKLDISGSAESQEVNISGSAEYNGSTLDSKDVKVVLSGSGITKVTADESLDINVSGSGSVEYKGSPKKLTQNISGIGTVKQVNN